MRPKLVVINKHANKGIQRPNSESIAFSEVSWRWSWMWPFWRPTRPSSPWFVGDATQYGRYERTHSGSCQWVEHFCHSTTKDGLLEDTYTQLSLIGNRSIKSPWKHPNLFARTTQLRWESVLIVACPVWKHLATCLQANGGWVWTKTTVLDLLVKQPRVPKERGTSREVRWLWRLDRQLLRTSSWVQAGNHRQTSSTNALTQLDINGGTHGHLRLEWLHRAVRSVWQVTGSNWPPTEQQARTHALNVREQLDHRHSWVSLLTVVHY
jgi:hypothetical protein